VGRAQIDAAAVDGEVVLICKQPWNANECSRSGIRSSSIPSSTSSNNTYFVHIRGATCNNAWRVNGVEDVTDEVSGSMPVYKYQGGKMRLSRLAQSMEVEVDGTQGSREFSSSSIRRQSLTIRPFVLTKSPFGSNLFLSKPIEERILLRLL